jgi:hypothetical protein
MNPPAPLLSIHLSSNRPQDFVSFLDRLQAATSDMSAVEVVVKIDATDRPMNELLPEQRRIRPFRVTYLSTPLAGGFYGLWKCYDELLAASHPDAYFVVGLNDEMHFKTKGWDVVLRKYVGLFPDHIFRLRTSLHRSRNYYDYWEAGFANDTSALMTKRWLTVGGGWCPCNGPDSFQQCVAFYFGWLDRFNAARTYREVAISDVELEGHGALHGLSGQAFRRRQGGALKPWFVLMSHAMQEEAARRAQKLHAQIWSDAHGAGAYEIRDNRRQRRIEVADRSSGAVRQALSYRLNPVRVGLTNAWRRLNFGFYCAGGRSNVLPWYQNLMIHLCLRYEALDSYFDLNQDTYAGRFARLRPFYFFARALLLAVRNLLRRQDKSRME